MCPHRVCLSHAPRSGPVEVAGLSSRTGACPLGLLVTRVVANGSLVARDQGVLDMAFPFTHQWPVRGWERRRGRERVW